MNSEANISKILDERVKLCRDCIISNIRANANIPESYEASVFRPKPDLAMLLFKKDRKSVSEYTLNLYTLKPTANSINKTLLADELKTPFLLAPLEVR